MGIRVTTKEELQEALAKAIRLNTTVVLDCMIDSDDKPQKDKVDFVHTKGRTIYAGQ